MDTITTIASLLKLSGSAHPVTVALTPSELRLIAAAPCLLEELEQQADGCSTIISLLDGQKSPVAASLVAMLKFQEANARAAIARDRGAA